jgi:hypothetical protein
MIRQAELESVAELLSRTQYTISALALGGQENDEKLKVVDVPSDTWVSNRIRHRLR